MSEEPRTYPALCVGGPDDGLTFRVTGLLPDRYADDGTRYRAALDSFRRLIKLADGTIVYKPWSAIG